MLNQTRCATVGCRRKHNDGGKRSSAVVMALALVAKPSFRLADGIGNGIIAAMRAVDIAGRLGVGKQPNGGVVRHAIDEPVARICAAKE